MYLVVHSDCKRKPRYWVTPDDVPTRTLFESESGSKAVQWAADHSPIVGIDGVIVPDRPIILPTGTLLKGYMKDDPVIAKGRRDK